MTNGSRSIDVNYAVVCDDIRMEASGKSIFIGVYTGNILVHAIPSVISLSFWFDLKLKAIGKHEIDVKFTVGTGHTAAFQFKAFLNAASLDTANGLAIGGVPLRIEQSGDLIVEFSVDGGDWFEAARKSVVVSQLPQQLSS